MTTRIVAIRHAKPASEGYAEDALRPLSDEGKEKQMRLTEILLQKGMIPQKILTSPLLRAVQTAQIAADKFGVEVEEEASLGNNFDSELLLSKILHPKEEMTIYLVGHAPTLGEFVNALTGETVLPFGLSKSSAAVVDFEDNIGFGCATFIEYIKL